MMAVTEAPYLEGIRHGTLTGYTTDKCRCEECRTFHAAYQREWKRARLASPDCTHGNRVTYLSGCRCTECRAANAAYNLKRKARLQVATDVPHGTTDGYGSYGCRCERCSAAKRAATRDHYLRHQVEFFEKVNRRLTLLNIDRRQVTSKDIARLIARHHGCCAYCGDRSQYMEIDHVIPLSRGGRHSIGNLIPACRLCNRRKSNRLLIEWRMSPTGRV